MLPCSWRQLVAADVWEGWAQEGGRVGLGWEIFPATKMSHYHADATKTRQYLGSWKDNYLFVFLTCRMVEKVTFHWECWKNPSSTWKIFFILTLKQNNVLSLLDVIFFFKINSWIIEWWRKALSETGKKNRIHLMFIMSLDYFRRVVTFRVSQTELKLNTYTWQPDPKFGHWGWHTSHSLA